MSNTEPKKIIEKRVLHLIKTCSRYKDNRWRWGEVMKALMEEKITLEPNDILEIGFTEGWNEGDSMRDDMYDLTLYKCREETDEEYESRMIRTAEMAAETEKRKYENYLKLKKHYEG